MSEVIGHVTEMGTKVKRRCRHTKDDPKADTIGTQMSSALD
jgi:hypothetical protein